MNTYTPHVPKTLSGRKMASKGANGETLRGFRSTNLGGLGSLEKLHGTC
jgi:hypothetical protein